MKTINILLLTLIGIGVGLLLTQKYWVPAMVTALLEREGVVSESETYEVVPEPPVVTEISTADMTKWNWVLSDVSSQETQFMYPNPLPTKYVTAQDWPPVVEMTAGEFSCVEGEVVTAEGLKKEFKKHTVGDRVYCTSLFSEGAAGSTFTTYEYTTAQGDFLVRIMFTLRTPQCLNYNEPEQNACKAEQAGFDVTGLIDRIASSIKMQ